VTEAVNAPNLRSLLPFLEGPASRTFWVSGGLWGDASLTWRDAPAATDVTALDALICLSTVVGRDVGAFDAPRCDVAPDSGANYDGTVNSLDALVILTFIVGSDVTGYRVGQPR
jgi:hypothetical protein